MNYHDERKLEDALFDYYDPNPERVNTNETQEIDIPADADWIDPLTAYNRGYRAGVEALREKVPMEFHWEDEEGDLVNVDLVADKLLTESEAQEQEKK